MQNFEDQDREPLVEVENGTRPTRKECRKRLKSFGKWILHLSYFAVLLGVFGGLIPEIINFQEHEVFTVSSVLATLVVYLTCYIFLTCAAYKWSPCHGFSTILLYLLLCITLVLDVWMFFTPPVLIFRRVEEWPSVQHAVEMAMNWSIPYYQSWPVYAVWDHTQYYMECCGVKAEYPYGGWNRLEHGWRVPPSCCKPGFEGTCMINPSSKSSYLDSGCLLETMPDVKIILFVLRIITFYCLAFTIAILEAISQQNDTPLPRRIVKLGRKYIPPFFQHWAVKIENESGESYWYEVGREGYRFSGIVSQSPGLNVITRGMGEHGAAVSTAGRWGGEIVGWTTKTDEEILGTELMNWIEENQYENVDMKKQDDGFVFTKMKSGTDGEVENELVSWNDEENIWLKEWLSAHPGYSLESENCQKFAYDFVVWLTDGVFNVPHRFDAARSFSPCGRYGGFSAFQRGNTIRRYGSGDRRIALFPFGVRYRWTEFQYQHIWSYCNPGCGVFLNASIVRVEASLGNIIGIHLDYNINTGLGVRNGNFEAHILGLGVKIGGDGVEVNSPVLGVNACSIM